MSTAHGYLPAFGHDLLLPFYDVVSRAAGVPAVHRTLLGHSDVRPGHRLLEVGCGTGNLTVLAKHLHPDAEVTACDPDPKALTRARGKLSATPSVRLDRAFGQDLPYPADSFDVVLSALMYHHLDAATKDRTLSEVRRVLRVGGMFLLADFGGQVTAQDGLRGRLQLRSERLRANLGEAIPRAIEVAGFAEVRELGHLLTRVGRVTFYGAR